ncbi:molybdopterin converting factor subunit 1 [Deinococcus sp. VB343]|uniref:Molybdopterin converting factor subunit 1 n=1 Tax=Deinococcus sp. VB142 TaxID=3112952 RepID=A0AAU6PZI2_9DEIO
MQIRAVFFARLRREVGLEELVLDVPEGADVRAVAAQLEQERGLSLSGCMVAVNETYAAPEQVLRGGDEVAFLPPVAGGSGEADTFCEVTAEVLTLAPADAFLVRPHCGAQAYFVGTVRSPNAGQVVAHIDYEAYAPMAQKVMEAAAALARARHGELRVWLQHRTGRLAPAEASIVIGVASPHRRAALEACDFLIEHLKVELPVWKHEATDSGEHWVSGQTGHEVL